MLRLPQFGVDTPETIEAVVRALADTPGSRLVAGGTDILPNLKHRLDQPPKLISLARVNELRGVELREGWLRIGAGETLSEIAENDLVREHAPSLAEAAGLVASPLIRNMGTIGGNLNLDTRCRYVNQTAFWRIALGGGCLKSEGNVCFVVPKGRNCVAAMSSDCVPVVISLDGEIELASSRGRRRVNVGEYYSPDGTAHTKAEADELTTSLWIPVSDTVRRTKYVKWTVRRSIDYPLISVALRFDLDGDAANALVSGTKVVAGVLGAKPRIVGKLEGVVGHRLGDPLVARVVSDAVHRQCKPLENVPYEAGYRRQMLRIHVRRAIESMAVLNG